MPPQKALREGILVWRDRSRRGLPFRVAPGLELAAGLAVAALQLADLLGEGTHLLAQGGYLGDDLLPRVGYRPAGGVGNVVGSNLGDVLPGLGLVLELLVLMLPLLEFVLPLLPFLPLLVLDELLGDLELLENGSLGLRAEQGCQVAHAKLAERRIGIQLGLGPVTLGHERLIRFFRLILSRHTDCPPNSVKGNTDCVACSLLL
jgi:hypothetical protein